MILSNEQIDDNLRLIVKRCKNYEPATAPLFEVMYQNGVRVQEAIDISLWSISEKNYLILKPQKFNDKRIFDFEEVPESFRDYLLHSKNWMLKPNYSRLNYLFKLFTIYPRIFIGKKQSSCHLFRHNFVKKLIEDGKSPEEIRFILGERHLKSAFAYINSTFSTVPQ